MTALATAGATSGVALAVALAAVCVVPGGVVPAFARDGWDASHARYLEDGEPVTGLRRIAGKFYAFQKDGTLLTESGRVGKAWCAVTPSGRLRGYQKGGWCHYPDGGFMSRRDALDFKAYKRACGIVDRITKPSDGKSRKRFKAFRWVMRKEYKIHRRWNYSRASWPAVYAFDHFDGHGGDCHADGAAFAYLAAAISYERIDVCIDAGPRAHQSHCWTMIDHSRIFDPLFAERNFSRYYNSRGGSYEVNPLHRIKICQFDKKHGKSTLPRKLKNEWIKQGGHWHYKLANGKDAVGSVKNSAETPIFKKGAYYVFDRSRRT